MKTHPMSTMRQFAITLLLVLTSGCASITGTTNQSISVQTRVPEGKEVAGAACELTNQKGKWFVTTPGSVTVTRSNDDMQVLCKKEGSEPGRASVVSATKGSMFGNIIFGGGIGAIVDHNSGAAYEYPALIQVLMGAFTKIEPPQTSAADQPDRNPYPQSTSTKSAASAPTQMVAPTQTSPAPREGKADDLPKQTLGRSPYVSMNPATTPSYSGTSVTAPITPSSGTQNASAAERLRELNKLYKDGLINQTDFDAKKQEILKTM